MDNPVLTICKPTFNRKSVLIPDLLEYLSVQDSRFAVKVNDNGSTDGTAEELKKISDSRLSYHINKTNLGPLPNCIAALKGAKSEYILLLIDKDTIDIKLLPRFIDYLQYKKPYFGYIDLSNNGPIHEMEFERGIPSVTHSAYLSKHPSGYFWRVELFENEICQPYFKDLKPTFDFQYEVLNGYLGAKYDCTIVYWPIIINETMRVKEEDMPKTKSYNDENFFFGKNKLKMTYRYYLSNMYQTALSEKDKVYMSTRLTNDTISRITVGLRRILQQKNVCYHYNLILRNVGFGEMLGNTMEVLKEYRTLSKDKLSLIDYAKSAFLLLSKSILKISYVCVKEVFIKPKQEPIKAG